VTWTALDTTTGRGLNLQAKYVTNLLKCRPNAIRKNIVRILVRVVHYMQPGLELPGGLNPPPPSQFMSRRSFLSENIGLAFKYFSHWAKFHTFRHLTAPSSFRSIPTLYALRGQNLLSDLPSVTRCFASKRLKISTCFRRLVTQSFQYSDGSMYRR